MNRLLKQQVEEFLGTIEDLPLNVRSFLNVVSNTYNNFSGIEEYEPGDNNPATYSQIDKDELNRENNELRKTHSELERLLNSINQQFFSRNMITDKYEYLSQGCEKIYGYTVQEFLNNDRLWYEVIHPDDRTLVETDDERLQNNEELKSEYRIIHKDKKIKWIELNIIPRFVNEKLTRIDGVVNDISDRKQSELEIEQVIKELTKSNADLKQFSFITSHNLRSPLTNILAILNIIEPKKLDDDTAQLLEMLKTSAQQLNKTIDDITKILLIKNNVDAELVDVNIKTAFEEILISFYGSLKEVNARVSTNFKSEIVFHNKVYIDSIFVNLLSNAIKYRSLSRPLVINIESEDDGEENFILRFSDNGRGIDVERYKDRIFGLYQRFHEKTEGQGLGLFIMKSHIESNGGSIEMESEPEKGTTFIIKLKKKKL